MVPERNLQDTRDVAGIRYFLDNWHETKGEFVML